MIGCDVKASNEFVGKVKDFYFDDHAWNVCYVVVDVGTWLKGRKVLVSPGEVSSIPNGQDTSLRLRLSADDVRKCPGIESDLPVSLQKERIDLKSYPIMAPPWPLLGVPVRPVFPVRGGEGEETCGGRKGDPFLRSVREVINYRLLSSDEKRFGHVSDFIVNTDGWIIRYLVVDTRYWLPGKQVLIAPLWLGRIDWTNALVYVRLPFEDVKNSPSFDPDSPMSDEYEKGLLEHYRHALGRTK
jgi:hypothetical protein